MRRIYLVSGPCGSGKTTFADAWARHLVRQGKKPVYLIHGDDFHQGFIEPEDKPGFFTEGQAADQVLWQDILRFNWECILSTADRALRMGLDVMIDYVIEDELPRMQELAEKHHAALYYVVLTADADELERRILLRGDTDLAERALFLKRELESMPENRGHLYNNTGKTTDEMLREICPEKYEIGGCRPNVPDGKVLFSVCTKPADPDSYPAGLAYAVHFSFRRPGQETQPLNRDYGILFARGTVSREDTIVPIGIRDPRIFQMEDGWIGICGDMIREDGEPFACDQGSVYLWKTRDLIRFEETGPVSEDALSGYHAASSLLVESGTAEEAIRRWTPIRAEKVLLPEESTVKAEEELEQIEADVVYSDGSRASRKVDWNTDSVDFARDGTYTVEGTIRRQAFRFPLARGYGDPVVFRREGKWYFLGTSDYRNDIGLYVREADSVEGLFAPDTAEHLILPYAPERGFEQTFWAPEFHMIGGEAYILFAVSGHVWGPQCHVMKLKKGGRITRAEDWENPVPVVRMDGTPLSPDGITLDMTYLRTGSGSYMVWSYRRHIGTPRDTGSMLYIATVCEREPWRLTGEPVLLSRPLYGWENVAGTINNEGPYALIRDGKVYLTYSGGSANSYTYALGMLTADGGMDLTDPGAWTKSITPVLTFRSVEGEYGPGHNSFFVNDLGDTMIAYHAETGLHEHVRCDGIRRVHFRKDGTPYFQMSAEEDLCGQRCTMKIHVTGHSRIQPRPKDAEGFLVEKGVLKKYTGSDQTARIPEGVRKIGDRAFSHCYRLTEAVLPDSVAEIGTEAFDNCLGLKRLNIPDRTDAIGADAFGHCSSRLTLSIGDNAYAEEYCDIYDLKYARRGEGSSDAGPDSGAEQSKHRSGPWDAVDWSSFCEEYHKDGDDPDVFLYDSAGYMRKGDQWGVLWNDGSEDEAGAEVIFPPQWDECEDLGSGYSPDGGLNGAYFFVRVIRNGLCGVVDTAGRTITPCKWDEIDEYGNARQGDLWGFVNLITCEETEPQWPENRHLQPYPEGKRFEQIANWASMFMGGSRLEWEPTMVLFAAQPAGYTPPRTRTVDEPAEIDNPDWKALKAQIRTGRADWLKSGDRIIVTLANRGKLRLQVARDSTGRIFFLSNPGAFRSRRMNEFGVQCPQGWVDTSMRKTLREEIFPLLPAELREAIEPTRILQIVHGRQIECNDRLFCLSRTQVFGGEHRTEPEDSQMDVFLRPDFRRKANNEANYWWWLRSGDPENNRFFMVRDNGPRNSRYPILCDGTLVTGIVFGFRL